ncbi:MAG: hypothetical protein WCD13_02450 [Pseudolabrys sp.]|jgi:hypothetical protein
MLSFHTLMGSAGAASRWVRSRGNSVNPKGEPKAPETVRRIPRKQFDAMMSGAMAAMRELQEFAKQAKSRLHDERPIMQDELAELLRRLVDAQKQISAEMESDIAKSADTGDTEWDRRSYNLFAVPTSQMANSLQAIVDLTLAASNNGAKNAKLLYELTVAEMDIAIARFNVTLTSGLITKAGQPD